jgi:uncharacterized protein YqeY
MSKLELLNQSFIQARKDKDEVAKALFSSFKGEYDNALKNKSPEGDSTIEKLAKKFTENAKIVNTADSLREIELLKPFMPIMLSEERIKEIVVEVANVNPDKANNYKLGSKGAFTGMVMKQIAGKADASIVTKVIEEVLA